MVKAPANTGTASNNKTEVKKRAHSIKGRRLNRIVGLCKIVTRKFIEPKIEDIPAICRLKIAKSTEAP